MAEIFHRKTGYRIYQIKKMFYHPEYPYMLADIDYFIDAAKRENGYSGDQDHKLQRQEINWWRDGEEIVPDQL